MATMATSYFICLCIMIASLARCAPVDNNDQNGTSVAKDFVRRFLAQPASHSLEHPTNASHDAKPSWSLWGDWSQSGTGSFCIYGRTRTCSSSKNTDCSGSNVELRHFNVSCKDTPQWSGWNPWICKHMDNGDCTSFRERFCSTNNKEDCLDGQSTEESYCSTDRCIGPFWKAWGDWSCSYRAGVCFMKRTRSCSTGMMGDCRHGLSTEVQLCDKKICQAPHLTPWSQWECAITAGTCFQYRHRSCSTGIESDCVGSKHEVDVCGDKCKGSDPQNTDMTTVSTTTDGTQTATTSPGPSSEEPTTQLFKVPTHPQTTGTDSKLSQLLIAPTKQRSYVHHDDSTELPTVPSQTATDKQKSVWSQWYFGACSVSCGGGSKQGIRRCSSGTENDCKGSAFSIVKCNTKTCPVNGGWGAWEVWGQCSQSCGNGTRTRHRLCNDPKPQRNGAPCHGSNEETETCKVTECPHWGELHDVGKCSVTCGVGFIQMKKDCSTGNDVDCTGSAYDEKPCELEQCPI